MGYPQTIFRIAAFCSTGRHANPAKPIPACPSIEYASLISCQAASVNHLRNARGGPSMLKVSALSRFMVKFGYLPSPSRARPWPQKSSRTLRISPRSPPSTFRISHDIQARWIAVIERKYVFGSTMNCPYSWSYYGVSALLRCAGTYCGWPKARLLRDRPARTEKQPGQKYEALEKLPESGGFVGVLP